MAEEKVSMPMTSAGIIGFSPDIKISGFEIDPKAMIIATFVLVLIVKIGGFVVQAGA
ncbi:hypothetical protein H0O02_00305 [Candidatus Micrarchaeota archaeon]|nr:hypothetical protein [Candidatus Micrarchaeota archaeon]